ncbi:helix-turn-helix domain-containing protein [Specibacter sp. NPDC078709]|uniref:helix-turn-helix domain-containing protein n=1 Tax=Specibacter sp. NPDC078709 TaxID=3154364 RepID=UPI00341B7FCB
MSPQSFSFHPSWDRMYTSGMTVQEISDYTGRARSTIHRHLQVRDAAERDCVPSTTPPGWRSDLTGQPHVGSICTRQPRNSTS